MSGKNLLRLMRPHQYIKNLFVYIGVLFGHDWTFNGFMQASVVFAAFCLCASGVYVLNDMVDVEADRAHPRKCHRPLASGRVSLAFARYFAIALLVCAALLAVLVSWAALALLCCYVLMNIAYSLRLKHVVLLDVFLISLGFMLRIFAGTLGIGIVPSVWLLLCGMMLTLFLGFCKRRSELKMVSSVQISGQNYTRRVLEDYSPMLLDQFTAISAACAILSYGLYTVSAQTIITHGSDYLILTLPPVVYAIFRYLYLVHAHGRGEDTARDLLTDKHLIISGLIWLAITLMILRVGL